LRGFSFSGAAFHDCKRLNPAQAHIFDLFCGFPQYFAPLVCVNISLAIIAEMRICAASMRRA
jgi:hypothetical protein